MFAADNPIIQQLLEAADRDAQTLAFPVPDEIFGFHVEQAVEKLLNSLSAAHGEPFEFIHALAPLVRQLENLGETIQMLSMQWDELSAYAVAARYVKGKPLSTLTRGVLREEVGDLRVHVERRQLELKAAGVLVRNP
jgi:hypothetical protein